ncbi:hypothetical protein LIA77_02071 [Sarocladium implicatum]|nr:hypothetical protein LIA77_02071 [Sarocladium implicatum]
MNGPDERYRLSPSPNRNHGSDNMEIRGPMNDAEGPSLQKHSVVTFSSLTDIYWVGHHGQVGVQPGGGERPRG